MELGFDQAHVPTGDADGRFLGSTPVRPVDLVHLARYTLGDTRYEREILGLFRTQSDNCLKRLEAADNEQARQDVANIIRDSARCIGAWRLARCAEALCGNALAVFPIAACQALRREIGEVNNYIGSLLADA